MMWLDDNSYKSGTPLQAHDDHDVDDDHDHNNSDDYEDDDDKVDKDNDMIRW